MRGSRRSHSGGAFSLFAFQDIIAAVTGVMLLLTLVLILELLQRPPGQRVGAATAAELESLTARRDALEHRLETAPPDTPAAVVTPGQFASLEASVRRLEAQTQQTAQALAEARAQEVELSARADRLEQRADAGRDALAQTRRQLAALERQPPVTMLEGPREGRTPWVVAVGPEGLGVGSVNEAGRVEPDRRFAGPGAERALLAWLDELDPLAHRVVLVVEPGGVERFDRLRDAVASRGFEIGWDLWAEPRPMLPAPEAGGDSGGNNGGNSGGTSGGSSGGGGETEPQP